MIIYLIYQKIFNEQDIQKKLNYHYNGCSLHSLLHKEKLQTIHLFFKNYDFNNFATNIWVISFTFNYYNKLQEKDYMHPNMSKILIHPEILNFNKLLKYYVNK